MDSWGSWALDLLPGLLVSLELTAVFVVLGIPYGLLLAIGGLQRNRVVSVISIAVIEVGRGVPALVIIYLVYFGLPQAGLTLAAFAATGVALAVSYGSYVSDVFRSGIQAVPLTQLEAASALGLGPSTTFFRVVLPQAVRIVIPPLLGWTIVYFQATSLAFAVSVPEILSRAYTLATADYQYLPVLILAALFYLAICVPASMLVDRLEHRRDSSAP